MTDINIKRIEVLIKERGYIVLGTKVPKRINSIIDFISGENGGKIPQPFYILKQTDIEDARKQEEILVKYNLSNGNIYNWPYFYRLSTD